MLDTNSPNYKKALRVERIANNTYTDIKFDIHLWCEEFEEIKFHFIH